MFKLLLRPFAYLFIQDNRKKGLDWRLPILLAFFTSLYLSLLIPEKDIIELIKSLLSFVQTLPGFFLAALAAIATFNRSDLDRIMPTPTPTINIERNGGKEEIKLTRRRYLTLMFSFLTAESIMLIVITSFGLFSVNGIVSYLLNWEYYCPVLGNIILLFIFFLLFWQLIIVNLYGLYYLGERIHQPD